jgi:hypothetical protein
MAHNDLAHIRLVYHWGVGDTISVRKFENYNVELPILDTALGGKPDL